MIAGIQLTYKGNIHSIMGGSVCGETDTSFSGHKSVVSYITDYFVLLSESSMNPSMALPKR